jgi:hypothetical protein
MEVAGGPGPLAIAAMTRATNGLRTGTAAPQYGSLFETVRRKPSCHLSLKFLLLQQELFLSSAFRNHLDLSECEASV